MMTLILDGRSVAPGDQSQGRVCACRGARVIAARVVGSRLKKLKMRRTEDQPSPRKNLMSLARPLDCFRQSSLSQCELRGVGVHHRNQSLVLSAIELLPGSSQIRARLVVGL